MAPAWHPSCRPLGWTTRPTVRRRLARGAGRDASRYSSSSSTPSKEAVSAVRSRASEKGAHERQDGDSRSGEAEARDTARRPVPLAREGADLRRRRRGGHCPPVVAEAEQVVHLLVREVEELG